MTNFDEINALLGKVMLKVVELEELTQRSIEFHDKLEIAFWKFDNRRCGFASGSPTERDAFKQVVAELIHDIS